MSTTTLFSRGALVMSVRVANHRVTKNNARE